MRSRNEIGTRRRFTTINECCRGYRKEGDECPIGEAETGELIRQSYAEKALRKFSFSEKVLKSSTKNIC